MTSIMQQSSGTIRIAHLRQVSDRIETDETPARIIAGSIVKLSRLLFDCFIAEKTTRAA
jgi:hypothetical protein